MKLSPAIIAMLENERRYQQVKWGNFNTSTGEFDEKFKSVGEFIVYMQQYMNEAIQATTKNVDDEPALDAMRKVVALGIACFEQHGPVFRKGKEYVNATTGKREWCY